MDAPDLLDPLLHPTVVVSSNTHESVLRSWHTLVVVEWLLEQGTPPAVTLAYIRSMRAADKENACPACCWTPRT